MRFLVAIVVVAALEMSSASFAMDLANGKDVYSRKCASCHGANGEGKETVAKTFKVQLRHLGSKEVQAMSDADLQKIMLEGHGKMKPVQGVDSKAAGDVVEFIRTLKP